jgi:hypothetical protein
VSHAICVLNPRETAGAAEIIAQFGAEQLGRLRAV